MITLRHDNRQFDYRVAAIAIQRDHVLLHRAEPDDFWALPGGRAEFGEESSVALSREMLEETGLSISIKRLVWSVENFFGLAGRHHHEIGFYFLVEFEDRESPKLDVAAEFYGYEEDGPRLIFRWFPLNALIGVRLYPSFLQTSLNALPTSITHIVQKDPDITQ
jgi:8-oxo-dGTP pyrophosphatase MutT (NUDIX family)